MQGSKFPPRFVTLCWMSRKKVVTAREQAPQMARAGGKASLDFLAVAEPEGRGGGMYPKAWALFTVVWAVWIAASIVLGDVQRWHQSDSILWGLISTDRLTPFYWGENRIGT